MTSYSKKTSKKIVLLIFLLICSGLGIAAFVMSLTKKCGEGFKNNNQREKSVGLKSNNNPTEMSIKDATWQCRLALALIRLPYKLTNDETPSNTYLSGGASSGVCWTFNNIFYSFNGLSLRAVGYINDERKEYLISIQGTNLLDAAHDMIDVTALYGLNSEEFAPMSVITLASSIYDQFNTVIPNNYNISIYGHSLGGLLAILIASIHRDDSRIKSVYTLNPWIGYSAFINYFSAAESWNKENVDLYIMYIPGDPASYMFTCEEFQQCEFFTSMLVYLFKKVLPFLPDPPPTNNVMWKNAKDNLGAQLIKLTDCSHKVSTFADLPIDQDPSTWSWEQEGMIFAQLSLAFKTSHTIDKEIETGYIAPIDQWVNDPGTRSKESVCPCSSTRKAAGSQYLDCPCDDDTQCGSNICAPDTHTCYYSKCADERKPLGSLYIGCPCDDGSQCGSKICDSDTHTCYYTKCADERKALHSLYFGCPCDDDTQCGSNICAPDTHTCYYSKCADERKPLGSLYTGCPCDDGSQCGSKICDSDTHTCYYTKCADERKALHSLYFGCPCDDDTQCGSNICAPDTHTCYYSKCADERKPLGSLYTGCPCDDGSQCGSKICDNQKCS